MAVLKKTNFYFTDPFGCLVSWRVCYLDGMEYSQTLFWLMDGSMFLLYNFHAFGLVDVGVFVFPRWCFHSSFLGKTL